MPISVHFSRSPTIGPSRPQRLHLEAGRPAPLQATTRWVVERTNAWQNAFKKLTWCTERKGALVSFYIAFANAIIIVRRLIREGWKRYRWEGRPARCP